jgi:hypothetical protein
MGARGGRCTAKSAGTGYIWRRGRHCQECAERCSEHNWNARGNKQLPAAKVRRDFAHTRWRSLQLRVRRETGGHNSNQKAQMPDAARKCRETQPAELRDRRGSYRTQNAHWNGTGKELPAVHRHPWRARIRVAPSASARAWRRNFRRATGREVRQTPYEDWRHGSDGLIRKTAKKYEMQIKEIAKGVVSCSESPASPRELRAESNSSVITVQ